MKRVLFFFALLGLGLFLAGCATCSKPDYAHDPKWSEIWQAYQTIDPSSLSEEQTEMLKKFDESDCRLTREEKKNFPWINPDGLSIRDKVFIMESRTIPIAAFLG